MAGKLGYGDEAARVVSGRILGSVATEAALVAIPASQREHGAVAITMDSYKIWVFDANSAETPSATILAVAAGTGQWIHAEAAPQA